jgi:hypothetical protein
MNPHSKKSLIAMRLCSLVILTSFIAAAAQAQTPATASANDRNDKRSAPARASRFRSVFVPLGLRPLSANDSRLNADQRVLKELDTAWHLSADGTSGREAVVLIFRRDDGSYIGKLQGFSNESQKASFKWRPAALAIVHTHPNKSDPRPTEQDRRVADKYRVPNFTISINGMYVYNPATKQTSKVLNGLDWLDAINLSQWTQEMARGQDASFHQVPESSYEQKPLCRVVVW